MAKKKKATKVVATLSEQEIGVAVENLFRQSLRDARKSAVFSSVNAVVHQLRADLGVDLSHKAHFITDHINFLRRSYPPPPPPPPPPPGGSGDPFAFRQFMSAHTHWMQQLGYHYPPQFPQPVFVYPSHAPPHHLHAPPHPAHVHQAGPSPPPPKKNDSALQKESSQSGAKKREGARGVDKLCGVSPELKALVGEEPMTKAEITKQLWVYIREKSLRDPSDCGKIICDEAFRAVFETDSFDTFQLDIKLKKHILPLDPAKESVSSKREVVDVESTPTCTGGTSPVSNPPQSLPHNQSEPPQQCDTLQPQPFHPPPQSAVAASCEAVNESSLSGSERESFAGTLEKRCRVSPELQAIVEVPVRSKRQKVNIEDTAEPREGGSTATISDALAAFLGTTRRTKVLPSEATQRVLEYVKGRILEDPSSMAVVCDAKLRELFGRDTVSILGIEDLVTRHHLLESS